MLVKDKSPNKSQMKAIESQMNSICFRFPHNQIKSLDHRLFVNKVKAKIIHCQN